MRSPSLRPKSEGACPELVEGGEAKEKSKFKTKTDTKIKKIEKTKNFFKRTCAMSITNKRPVETGLMCLKLFYLLNY